MEDTGIRHFPLEKTRDGSLRGEQVQAGRRVHWSTVPSPGVKALAMQKEKSSGKQSL